MPAAPSVPDGTGLIAIDPWLAPYAEALRHRYHNYQATLRRIEEAFGSLAGISHGHEYFGFNRGECDGRPGVWYREWAPGPMRSIWPATSTGGTARRTRWCAMRTACGVSFCRTRNIPAGWCTAAR